MMVTLMKVLVVVTVVVMLKNTTTMPGVIMDSAGANCDGML